MCARGTNLAYGQPMTTSNPPNDATPPETTSLRVTARDIQGVMFGGEFPPYGIAHRDGNVVGVQIGKVAAGSAAERLGARDGDIIEAVNGVELTSWDALTRVEDSTRDGRRFDVRIRRGDRTVNLSIEVVS
jgi:S1-C subfamily serine protease